MTKGTSALLQGLWGSLLPSAAGPHLPVVTCVLIAVLLVAFDILCRIEFQLGFDFPNLIPECWDSLCISSSLPVSPFTFSLFLFGIYAWPGPVHSSICWPVTMRRPCPSPSCLLWCCAACWHTPQPLYLVTWPFRLGVQGCYKYWGAGMGIISCC